MSTRDMLPPDLLEEMLQNGVKFDENGEIIEDDDTSEDDTSDENQNDEGDEATEEDATEVADEEGEDDDQTDDQENTDEDGDEEAPRKVVKTKVEVKSRISLTPKTEEKDETQNSEVAELRRQLAALQAKIETKSSEKEETEDDDTLATNLRQEVAKFRNMRMKEFAGSVETTVDVMYPEASFKDIIASKEWEQYQNSRVMGARVGDLYLATIKSENKDDVVSFFSDFVDRYLPSLSKAKPIAAAMKKVVKKPEGKPELKDMALPEKAKATAPNSKRSGFDYKASDYGMMLEKAEKGQISLTDFTKFEDKFFKAEREGRVKNE